MTSMQIDDNNNLVVINNSISVVNGIVACAQDTKTRVGIVRGENPYNIEQGVAYFDEILDKFGGIDYLRIVITERILDNTEIRDVSNLEIQKDGDITRITADVETIYGAIQL